MPRHRGRVTSFISHTTIDCANAYELSEWWKQLLGYVDLADDPNAPGHEECLIQRPDGGHQILFLEVPDVKSVKNRLHFDLRPSERTRDDEVEWALGIGATQVEDHRDKYGPGTGWVVLADPEGNEFCILRSESEVASGITSGSA
jgi:catechol 2,3-dioxygenase-like lactoylglutathione lyase family enzyme